MKLLTAPILKKLIKNGEATTKAQEEGKDEPDHVPVVKFFNPYGSATWLFTEAEKTDDDLILFGLCDLGFGTPELGSVSLNELESVKKFGRTQVERDMYWTGKSPCRNIPMRL